ncbi:MAG: hypothetical protein EZS28_026742, partial [Streblomastix strix]
MQPVPAKGSPIVNATFGQGPSLLAQQLRSANNEQPRYSPSSTGRESQSLQFPLASISTTRFIEPGRGVPGSLHLSPFTQANERSRKMAEESERIKREKAEGKAMERAGPEKKSESPEKTLKVSEATERSKGSGGRTDRTQQTSATTEVKKTARKAGELQNVAIRDLLTFDERELDQYAIKVKPENVRGATGGKWKQMRPDEILHFGQVERTGFAGVTKLDESGGIINEKEPTGLRSQILKLQGSGKRTERSKKYDKTERSQDGTQQQQEQEDGSNDVEQQSTGRTVPDWSMLSDLGTQSTKPIKGRTLPPLNLNNGDRSQRQNQLGSFQLATTSRAPPIKLQPTPD